MAVVGLHILPTFQDRPLAAIRPSEIQAWVKARRQVLAPSSLKVKYRWLAIETMPERYRAPTVVAAATGLRQGEVFGLTVDHLDFLRRQLHVEQQMKHLAPRPPFLARPKTPSSVRTVPLPDVALEATAEHLRLWPAHTTMRAVSGRDELLAFTTGRGGPLTRATFNMTWRKAVKAARLPEGTGFHGLRHCYASLLIASGAW